MELVKQDGQQKEGNQALMLKQYLINLLIIELYEEVHNGDAADSIFKSMEPIQVLDNLWSKWQEAVAFFDIWNYPVVTEEDLADWFSAHLISNNQPAIIMPLESEQLR